MNQTPFAMSSPSMTQTQARAAQVGIFMRGVYFWMCLGLLATAGMSFLTLATPALGSLLVTQGGGLSLLYFGCIIAELVLVVVLSARIGRLSAATATGLFMLYSLLNGVTLSVLLAVYTSASVVSTFLVCSGMFGAMSVYGMVAKKDLTGWGSFLFMGLIGIVLASIVNIFLGSSMVHFAISMAGVIIFTGLTAYDTQKLKHMGETMPLGDATVLRRGMILGALQLYLDFINLFIMLLRLLGDRR